MTGRWSFTKVLRDDAVELSWRANGRVVAVVGTIALDSPKGLILLKFNHLAENSVLPNDFPPELFEPKSELQILGSVRRVDSTGIIRVKAETHLYAGGNDLLVLGSRGTCLRQPFILAKTHVLVTRSTVRSGKHVIFPPREWVRR